MTANNPFSLCNSSDIKRDCIKGRIEEQISNTNQRKDIPIQVFKKSKVKEEQLGELRQKGRNDI